MSDPPADRLAEFYRLVRALVELRIAVGYDLDMKVPPSPDGFGAASNGARYRVRITLEVASDATKPRDD